MRAVTTTRMTFKSKALEALTDRQPNDPNGRHFLELLDLPVGRKGFGSPSNPVQVC